MTDENQTNLIELTADIVSAYVQKNAVPVAGLPDLIASVNLALAQVNNPPPAPAELQKPAVNPKRSVFPDYIVNLEDGKKYKSLKRNLRTAYNMSPEEYREKWGLPKDYPMVAPNYSATRSALAKTLGLGRKTAPAPVKKAAPKRKAKA
ncbi:transcriptional regulator [Mesorhizobium sp. M3A.F.Ca.ET.174.01.1.1]|uniref:MucR family transcriptional regulator n=1 Tax=unclassified Mesorhizobium TaxID=325217 RepID=UPI001093F066|nr:MULTISPECIES: MucR family transcriptional regulator [unclassified Mesorhizobium]TGS85781.1 transcriptional regulator [Mesorhizobium sp. M3A.F.Ca.ET.175.01.1.1]TGT23909.1 transcriptional regulator [Mesorhizobium sp. M3A.F.Ca.ET.174.01.1.1]